MEIAIKVDDKEIIKYLLEYHEPKEVILSSAQDKIIDSINTKRILDLNNILKDLKYVSDY